MRVHNHLNPFLRMSVCILLFAFFLIPAFAQTTQMPQRTPVAEQLAAIPDLDRRIADLEKTLNAATDQKSLTATTARWILDITKEVQKDPKAFDGRPVSNALRPSPAETPTRGATPSAAPP